MNELYISIRKFTGYGKHYHIKLSLKKPSSVMKNGEKCLGLELYEDSQVFNTPEEVDEYIKLKKAKYIDCNIKINDPDFCDSVYIWIYKDGD